VSLAIDVVAVGARTPVGLTAESSAAAVRAGISKYAEFPFADPRGEPIAVAADARLDPALEGRDRCAPMILSVLEEIGEKLGEESPPAGRRHVLLALPEARPGFSDGDAEWVVNAVRTHLRSTASDARVELVGRGHAGAIRAIEQAAQACTEARDELFLVAGVDSYLHAETFLWLERARRLAQPEIRNGFTPGEGAGCLVLANPEVRRRWRLPRLAVVRGVGTAREALLRDSDTGSFGVGMARAVEGAVTGLALPRDGADVLYTDINGERYRSEEWGFVALRTPLVWKSLVYEAPSNCWGDVGAAFLNI
jgi:3-oxoacyl-[acyl-carrier-protein] synthase-1